MTFGIDNPEGGGCNNPPLGKYVWEKPSGEQGLNTNLNTNLMQGHRDSSVSPCSLPEINEHRIFCLAWKREAL